MEGIGEVGVALRGERKLRVGVRVAVSCVALVLWSAVTQADVARAWAVRSASAATVLQGDLLAVSCTSSSACTAVGDLASDGSRTATLAERWNGVTWAIQSTPTPAGAIGASLQGVSCTSSRACIAVGSSTNRAGIARTLAERWNGVRWVVLSTPRDHARGGVFRGVSCAWRRACIAVGSLAGAALVERWNGVKWAMQTTPKLPGQTVDLSGVSCSSSKACTAVGTFHVTNGLSPTQLAPSQLAERWNGARWVIQKTPDVFNGGSLVGVSCPSGRVCSAVGVEDLVEGGPPHPLVDRWNGVRWRIQNAPLAPEAPGGSLGAVSCPSSDACTAVGQPFGSPGVLVERWDGASWTVQTAPGLPGTGDNFLNGVSCPSSDACVAVASGAYAELWNGLSWALQNTLSPTGT